MVCVWVVVSTARAAAETSTAVVCWPTESLIGIVRMVPAITSTLVMVEVEKPGAATVTVYIPSGMSWNAN